MTTILNYSTHQYTQSNPNYGTQNTGSWQHPEQESFRSLWQQWTSSPKMADLATLKTRAIWCPNWNCRTRRGLSSSSQLRKRLLRSKTSTLHTTWPKSRPVEKMTAPSIAGWLLCFISFSLHLTASPGLSSKQPFLIIRVLSKLILNIFLDGRPAMLWSIRYFYQLLSLIH